jgi:hypothetical protein
MSQSPSDFTDKTIVDRRKSYRNSDVRIAVRKTRDRLAEQGISDPGFDRELLAINSRTVLSGTPAIVLLIAMIALVATLSGMGANMLIWAIAATVVVIARGFIARRYLEMPRTIVFRAAAPGSCSPRTSCSDCAGHGSPSRPARPAAASTCFSSSRWLCWSRWPRA